MPIAEFCNREVIIAERNCAVLEAAGLMRQFHVGSLVIVDKLDGPRVPVGIVTDRDVVVEMVVNKLDPATVTVGEIMTESLTTVRGRATESSIPSSSCAARACGGYRLWTTAASCLG